MFEKLLCKIKYRDISSKTAKIECFEVEESQVDLFYHGATDFICVERVDNHILVAIPVDNIEELEMYEPRGRITRSRTVAEIC